METKNINVATKWELNKPTHCYGSHAICTYCTGPFGTKYPGELMVSTTQMTCHPAAEFRPN